MISHISRRSRFEKSSNHTYRWSRFSYGQHIYPSAHIISVKIVVKLLENIKVLMTDDDSAQINYKGMIR